MCVSEWLMSSPCFHLLLVTSVFFFLQVFPPELMHFPNPHYVYKIFHMKFTDLSSVSLSYTNLYFRTMTMSCCRKPGLWFV
jgi:hypothetical protein